MPIHDHLHAAHRRSMAIAIQSGRLRRPAIRLGVRFCRRRCESFRREVWPDGKGTGSRRSAVHLLPCEPVLRHDGVVPLDRSAGEYRRLIQLRRPHVEAPAQLGRQLTRLTSGRGGVGLQRLFTRHTSCGNCPLDVSQTMVIGPIATPSAFLVPDLAARSFPTATGRPAVSPPLSAPGFCGRNQHGCASQPRDGADIKLIELGAFDGQIRRAAGSPTRRTFRRFLKPLSNTLQVRSRVSSAGIFAA